MEVKKGQNILEHEAEIYSRPARTWFQSGRDKQQTEGVSIYRVYLCCHKSANLALSKRQYENNFQKDNSINPKTGSKAQVDKVLFSGFNEESVLTDTRTWKRKRDKFSGLTRRAKRRKLASEGETKEDRKANDAAVRSAKKSARPARISVLNEQPARQGKAKQSDKLGKAGFSHDQGGRGSRKEGFRAKRGDVAKIKGRRRR
jgi:ATP-dependent RNA helicase DDX27